MNINEIQINAIKTNMRLFGQEIKVCSSLKGTYVPTVAIVKFGRANVQEITGTVGSSGGSTTTLFTTLKDEYYFTSLTPIELNDYIMYNAYIYQVCSTNTTVKGVYKCYAEYDSPISHSITASVTSTELNMDTTFQIKCTCEENGSRVKNPIITYKVNNKNVEVDSTGLVTPKICGTCVVTCSYESQSVDIIFEVTNNIFTIASEKDSYNIYIDKTQQLNMTCTLNAEVVSNPTITYKSNNNKIATVDSTGLVKGISEGEVVITSQYNTVSTEVIITVEKEPEGSYSITCNSFDGSYRIRKYSSVNFVVNGIDGTPSVDTWNIVLDRKGISETDLPIVEQTSNSIKLKNPKGTNTIKPTLTFTNSRDTSIVLEIEIQLIYQS